jgi:ankyrin repeat protein
MLTEEGAGPGPVRDRLQPEFTDSSMQDLSSTSSQETSKGSHREPSPERQARENLLRQTIDSGKSLLDSYGRRGESKEPKPSTVDELESKSSSSKHDNDDENMTELTEPTKPHHDRGNSFASAWKSAIHEEERESLDMLNKLVSKYEKSAQELVAAGSFSRAAERMTKAIKYANDRNKWYDVPFSRIEMEDTLAEIYRKQGNFHEALDIWEQLLPGRSVNEIHLTMEQIRHFYLVAETYFEMWKQNREADHLNAAFTRGKTSFTNREKHHVDAGSPLLADIAELMMRISEAMSETVLADTYRDYTSHSTHRESISAPSMGKSASSSGQEDAELNPGEDATLAFARAIHRNNVPRALRILEKHADSIDIERQFNKGLTPLMIAFQHCRSEAMIETLLARGANIHAADSLGRTVLHRAAADGDAEMTTSAIRKDAKVEARDQGGLTPLMLCAAENHPRALGVIRVLLENDISRADVNATGGDNNFTALHFAAQNCAKLSSSLAKSGTAKADGVSADTDYKVRATKIMELLCSPPYNATVDAVAITGNTPLCMVSQAGYFPAVEALLKLNAEPNHRNRKHRTPLFLATYEKPTTPEYQSTVWALIAGGADTSNESELPSNWANGFKQLVEEERRRRAEEGSPGNGSLLAPTKPKSRSRASSEAFASTKRKDSTVSTDTAASKSSTWSRKLGLRKSG